MNPNEAANTNNEPKLTPFQAWEKSPETSEAAAEEVETAPASEPAQPKEPAKASIEEDEEDEEALPKGLKKRFRKLTGKIRDLESQLAKPAAAAPAQADDEVKKAPATPPASDQKNAKPTLAQFETYEDFVEALADWKADQRDLRRAEEAKKAEHEQAARKQESEWKAKVEEAKARYDDWADVVDGATDVPVTAAMKQAIFEMDRGPDVVHFLASNPDEAKRISKLSPLSQARELGKIEDKLPALEAEAEIKKPVVSKAARPAKVITGSTGNDLGREPDPKDFAKWSKWKDRQEALARGD